MGQTLGSAAHWTSARDGGRGKLEYTPTNEAILNSIISFVESFPVQHQHESEVVFQKPLVWATAITPDALALKPGKEGMFVSDQAGPNGVSHCTMKKDGSHYVISISTLAFCEKIMKTAASNKMTECRACLEANNDPAANMLGNRFATVSGPDSSTYRLVEEIMRTEEKPKGEEQSTDKVSDDTENKKMILRLLLIVKDFDEKLLNTALKQISSEVKLSPPDVDRMLEVLQRYSGQDEDRHVLHSIEWLQPYDFRYNNGCRAPFWRQVHGDISYIKVKPHDTDVLYITACTNGYFVNQGFDAGHNELIYEKKSDYFRDLIRLLRDQSPRFNDLIDRHDFFKRKEDEKKAFMEIAKDHHSKEEKGTEAKESQNKATDKEQKDDGSPRKTPRKKMQPSLKWQVIGVEHGHEKEGKNDLENFKKPQKGQPVTAPIKSEHHHHGDESFDESSSESEEEEEAPDRRTDGGTDLPSEYWQIQKLVKYLKGGNQTATIIALCSMQDFNLQQETCQLAIRDVGGLEVLINLLDTEEIKCKIGALNILKEISKNTQIRRAIADLGGLQTMVKILREPDKELKCLAAETIANVAKFRRARRTVRQHGGIKRLVALLDCIPHGAHGTQIDNMRDVDVARCGALALWSCSKSTRNKQAMRKAGVIPLLAKLLKSKNENMLVPVVGTLQECASEQSYRLAIRTEGMIEDLVSNLHSENTQLQMHCASAIFKCAEEKQTRDLVRQFGGLDPLVKLLSKKDDKELLAAVTGAIWKCAISRENVARFQELRCIELLVGLLQDQPEEVLVNVVGALAELAKDPPNRMTIRKSGGIPSLVNLLTGTNQALLINVTQAVGQCAEEPDNMVVIDKMDGVRLLWSLLKNSNPQVQASAAWAICPCIENAKDAGEMVRSFVGGLELIVSLLETKHQEVLASVCAAIANIAVDEENLAVITDHGVVPKLARLTNTNDDRLRRHLAEAIARCCNWGNNRIAFGKEQAVAPLVRYLKSKDMAVHRSTAKALHQLSKDPDNCITMHEAGAVKPLMEMVGSDDDVLQEAAAGCIANIRRLALANEKARTGRSK